jgi:hypothetical protein
MREDDEKDPGRWDTVNLKPDQLEQVLATDYVETMRIDRPMQIVFARLDGRPEPKAKVVSFAAPIGLCTLAIVFGSLALLLESDLWQASWRVPGMIGFGAAALATGVGAVVLLVLRLQERA